MLILAPLTDWCEQDYHFVSNRTRWHRDPQPGAGRSKAGTNPANPRLTLAILTAWMDSVTEPIWLTLSRRALQAFFSMAGCTRLGLVTSRSSPTTCSTRSQDSAQALDAEARMRATFIGSSDLQRECC